MPAIPTVVLNSDKVIAAITRRGLMRRELAALADLSEATVRTAISGRPLSFRAARRIADALGIPFEQVTDADSTMPARVPDVGAA